MYGGGEPRCEPDIVLLIGDDDVVVMVMAIVVASRPSCNWRTCSNMINYSFSDLNLYFVDGTGSLYNIIPVFAYHSYQLLE